MGFDRPFFGARVLIPMSIAGVLAALAIGMWRLPWYWGVLALIVSNAVVLSATICLERRK